MENPSREERLQQALVAGIEAAESGRADDRDAVLARYPEFATELREFFAERSNVERLAQPFRQAPPASGADAPTTGLAEVAAPPPGTKIGYFGDYELLQEIGRGGMGVVYKARQASLKRIVALKLILTGQLANEDDVKRFHAEAQAAARLDHPGIVAVFEVGLHEGHHYFSMAFVEGESLARKVAVEPLPPRQAATLTKQVAEAVNYAHVEGVVHRDLKPANILIDKSGQPRLTDFGLAKRVQSEPGTTGAELTHTGQVLGTPSYMPPEQASGRRGVVGPVSDVYSLGAILYCLLTGRPPFQAATALDTLLQVLDQDPVPPRQLNCSIPRDLETICLKCLEKEPGKRYASARDLVADLDRYLTGQPIHARPASRRERVVKWVRRRPATAALLGVSAAAMIAFVVFGAIYVNNARRLAVAERARGELLLSHIYSSDLALAVVAFDKQNVTVTHDYLNATRPKPGEPDLRGFEWHYLWRQTKRERLTFPTVQLHDEDSERVVQRQRLVFSADGKLLATRHSIAEVATGRVRLEIKAPEGARLFFSADGRYLLAGMDIFEIPAQPGAPAKITKIPPPPPDKEPPNPQSTAAQAEPLGFLGDTNSVVVLYTGKKPYYIVAETLAVVKLIDAATGKETATDFQVRPEHRIVASTLSSKCGLLAVATPRFSSSSNEIDLVEVWDLLKGGKQVLEFQRFDGKSVWGSWDQGLRGQYPGMLLFTDDGATLAVLTRDHSLRLCDTTTGKERVRLGPNQRRHVAFSGDNKKFMQLARVYPGPQGGYEKTKLEIWDIATGKELASSDISFAGYANSFGQQPEAALSPDGKFYATGGGTKVVQLWDTATGKLRAACLGHKEPIRDLVFSPDGAVLATRDQMRRTPAGDMTVKLWNTAEEKPIGLPVDTAAITTFALSPDRNLIAAGFENGAIRLCDLKTLKVLRDFKHQAPSVQMLQFAPDGKLLVASHLGAAKDNNIDVWDTSEGKVVASFPGFLRGFNGKTVASLDKLQRYLGTPEPPDTITLFDVATKARRLEMKDTQDKVFGMSPDGSVAATAVEARHKPPIIANYRTKVWNTATGKETPSPEAFESHGNRPSHLIFSPNGKFLVMCNTNLLVLKEGAKEPAYPSAGRLYDVATGKTIVQFPLTYRYGESFGGISNWTMAEFSPDSKLLMTVGNDGDKYRAKLSLWDTATGKEVTSLPNPDKFAYMLATFAPDGKSIAVVTIGSWKCQRYKDGKMVNDDSAITIERENVGYDGDSVGNSGGSGGLGTIHPVYEVHVWDVGQDSNPAPAGQDRSPVPQRKRRFLVSWQMPIERMAFAGDSQLIYVLLNRRPNESGGPSRRLQAWDIATGKEVASVGGHGTRFHALTYAADGRLLALTDQITNQRRPRNHPNDYRIRTWEIPLKGEPGVSATGDVSGPEARELSAPQTFIAPDLPLDLDPKSLAVAPNTRDEQDGAEDFYSHGSHSTTAISPDGKVKAVRAYRWPIQSSGPDGRVKIDPSPTDVTLIDVATGKVTHTLKGYGQWVCRLAFTPDGRTLAVGDHNGKIHLWNVAAGRLLLTIDAHTGPVSGLAFRADGRVLASCNDAEIRLWRAETEE